MNKGTKIRTIVFAIACVNQSIVAVGDVDFGNHTVNVIYKVISTVFTIIAGTIALYYNNDFTAVAAEYTGAMRAEKARLRGEDDGLGIEVEEYLEDGDEDE